MGCNSKYKSKRTAFKTDKRQQHTLMKFLENICIVEEDDLQSSVNNNIEPNIEPPPTIDLDDEISIEETIKESTVEGKKNKEDTIEDENPNFKTMQNNYMITHQLQEKWEMVYPFAIYSVRAKRMALKSLFRLW